MFELNYLSAEAKAAFGGWVNDRKLSGIDEPPVWMSGSYSRKAAAHSGVGSRRIA